MNALYQAAADLQSFVTDSGWPFCIIGGLAVQRWGVQRVTVASPGERLNISRILDEIGPLAKTKEDGSIVPRLVALLEKHDLG